MESDVKQSEQAQQLTKVSSEASCVQDSAWIHAFIYIYTVCVLNRKKKALVWELLWL